MALDQIGLRNRTVMVNDEQCRPGSDCCAASALSTLILKTKESQVCVSYDDHRPMMIVWANEKINKNDLVLRNPDYNFWT